LSRFYTECLVMKISLNWLNQYFDNPLSPEHTLDLLTSLGLEVEGSEKSEAGYNGLQGILVGEVLTCVKHPEADRLSLCTVYIGAESPLHIVCGAPNVAAGQKVLVATSGAEVLGKDGKPFTIKKGRIRGADSEGMICAEDELGLGTDHAGILVLDQTAIPGTRAGDQLGLKEDWIIEIGLTPNRSDATNHLGVARDLYAALKVRHQVDGKLVPPDVSGFKAGKDANGVSVIVENHNACPRYSGITLSGLKVGPSPEWLRQALTAIGERPINNVVDATNYVLHELGQPLHAFDLDKIQGKTIRVKMLDTYLPFVSLDGQERVLNQTDLMICDGDSRPMCMAGIFGGLHSGVSEQTTSIFLESAYFDPGTIRRSSTRHGLRTEAAKIYEKGADPEVTIYALERAALLISELTGGHISSSIFDIYPEKVAPARVLVRLEKVCALTGVPFTTADLHRIFEAMGMPVLEEKNGHFTVQVPGNKSDVTREVDVIEEILRIYGYDQVPEPGRMSVSVQTMAKPDPVGLREKVAGLLSSRGFSEAMNLSLDQSGRYQKFLVGHFPDLVKIHNTSNMHLDCLRPAMLPNMLESVLRNHNRQQADLRMYEFGKTYRREGDQIIETNRLLLVMTGRREAESWLNTSRTAIDFYTLKSEVTAIMRLLRIQGWQEQSVPAEDGLEPGISWCRGPQELVKLGAASGEIMEDMDIDQTVWVADFNWDLLLKALPAKDLETAPLNRFPTVRRDLALVLDKQVAYKDVEALARKTEKKLLQSVELFDVFESAEALGEGKKSCAISFRFADAEKTLTDGEIDAVMDKLIQGYESKLGAVIRR
jgi:phenylalanyl-tRNA synthetase beta chain